MWSGSLLWRLSVPVPPAALSPCGIGKVVLYRQLGPPSVQGLAFASGYSKPDYLKAVSASLWVSAHRS